MRCIYAYFYALKSTNAYASKIDFLIKGLIEACDQFVSVSHAVTKKGEHGWQAQGGPHPYHSQDN